MYGLKILKSLVTAALGALLAALGFQSKPDLKPQNVVPAPVQVASYIPAPPQVYLPPAPPKAPQTKSACKVVRISTHRTKAKTRATAESRIDLTTSIDHLQRSIQAKVASKLEAASALVRASED